MGCLCWISHKHAYAGLMRRGVYAVLVEKILRTSDCYDVNKSANIFYVDAKCVVCALNMVQYDTKFVLFLPGSTTFGIAIEVVCYGVHYGVP